MFLYESPEVLVSDGGFLVQPGVNPAGFLISSSSSSQPRTMGNSGVYLMLLVVSQRSSSFPVAMFRRASGVVIPVVFFGTAFPPSGLLTSFLRSAKMWSSKGA